METRVLRHAYAQRAGTPVHRSAFQRFCGDVRANGTGSAFPCYFAVRGLARDQLRYCFLPGETARDLDALAASLRAYLPRAPAIGPTTSLVVFLATDTRQARPLEEYRARFWSVLAGLQQRDVAEWPGEVPRDPEDPSWEFCFAGTPLFVVCNTPSHHARRSRYAQVMTLTFQPRWVFDGIEGGTASGDAARRTIRQRLRSYDDVPPSPELHDYGADGNREWTQYFLDDHNDAVPSLTSCPLRQPQRA